MYKVLIVDDEPKTTENLKDYVSKKVGDFIKINEATSAYEARGLLEMTHYDLVVCDVNMPEENGISLMEHIINKFSNIKIIMLSGENDFNSLYIIQKKNIKFVSKLESAEYILQIIQELLMGMESKPQIAIENEFKDIVDLVQVVTNYINEHYQQDITLESLADMVFINSSYLSRMFKKINGVALFEYINEVRINKAIELLKNPRLQLKDIVDQVGYRSIQYFHRIFKLKTSVTPQQYRRNHMIFEIK